ncbi:hypothetical protein [Nakamurella aerolata]|uniref:hypothetical protein n=1 Tax=Nakamurella aerolata TaxID=1656892 RepID=UPI001BB27D90|nr:hypothetical protein [Nakamurella aerolata]
MTGIVDSVEAWLAGVSFWIQVPILLGVLVPLCWLLAGLIDRVVDLVLRRHGGKGLAPSRERADSTPVAEP